MAPVPFVESRGNGSMNASVTGYGMLVSGGYFRFAADAVETEKQVTYHTPGVLTNLYLRVITNSRGASTTKIRINGGDGNGGFTIGASTTGEFEDTTSRDIIADGDEVCFQLITGSGGSAFIEQVSGVVFTADSGTVTLLGGYASTTFNVASTTYFLNLSYSVGTLSTSVTEVRAQSKFHGAGTLENAFINVTSNTTALDVLARTRINGADGNILLTITALTTGFFEDTSNSDTIAADDMVCFSITTPAGIISTVIKQFKIEFTSNEDNFYFAIANASGLTVNANLTRYGVLSGPGDTNGMNATESTWQSKARVNYLATRLQTYLSANTVTATSTIITRIDAGNGIQTLSIAASTTGYFEDTTNTEVFSIANEVNYRLVTGATGTSLTLHFIGMMGTALIPLVTVSNNQLMLVAAGT